MNLHSRTKPGTARMFTTETGDTPKPGTPRVFPWGQTPLAFRTMVARSVPETYSLHCASSSGCAQPADRRAGLQCQSSCRKSAGVGSASPWKWREAERQAALRGPAGNRAALAQNSVAIGPRVHPRKHLSKTRLMFIDERWLLDTNNLLRMIFALIASMTSRGIIPLTVACVPTGMNTGVSRMPCGL